MRYRALVVLLTLACSAQAFGQACLIHSQGQNIEVKLCQQNRSIPSALFQSGFCKPQLQGQQVSVSYVEQCPQGAYAVCRNAMAGGSFYRQDIYYYGVASDSRLLKPYCEQRSKGVWLEQSSAIPNAIVPNTPRH